MERESGSGGGRIEPAIKRLTAAGLLHRFVLTSGRPVAAESHAQPGWYRIPDSR